MQEELKDYQVNPDIPTMRLYKCWDSSAVISEDEQSRSTNVAREGAISASQATSLMFES
jgi:hypothetical protein